jgi:hypothetical protein
MLLSSLAACGKRISGTYSAEIAGSGAEFKFSGSKVTITTKVFGSVVSTSEGEYSIKDDKITFEFEKEDSDDVKKYNGTFDFEKKDDSIKIGVVTYDKND